MEQLKGFTADIFRSNYDCIINKMQGKKRVTIIDPALPKMFEASDSHPGVKIVRRDLSNGIYLHMEPIEPGFYAFGWSFIYSSDSRFSDISKYPIPLHDRQMNLER